MIAEGAIGQLPPWPMVNGPLFAVSASLALAGAVLTPDAAFAVTAAAGRSSASTARMAADTTGMTIALPARSESCTSLSVPSSSLSAGMPDRRSFS